MNKRVGPALAVSLLAAATLLSMLSILSENATAVWNVETVDSGGDVGSHTSIAVDSSGFPRISYEDTTNTSLKYAKWNGTGWEIQTVDATGCTPIWNSMVVDSAGNAHIAYDACGTLKYAVSGGAVWMTRTVESGTVGEYPSIALDGSSRPHISYHNYTSDDLRYAKWNGTGWETETVDSTGSVGDWTSLALDASGYAHISYQFQTNRDLRHAQWNGTGWVITTVDTGGQVGYSTSLALDPSGYPHIAYHNSNGRTVKYALWNGTAWNSQNVDTIGTSTTFGVDSLSLDKGGYPRIAYYDVTNGNLKYAKWNGTAWAIEVVDSSGDVGMWPSLALDQSGGAHISYYNVTNGDLKYTGFPNSPPNPPSIPSGSMLGRIGTPYTYTTAATDPDGDPVRYTFDWGDSTTSDTGYNASGAVANFTHVWNAVGRYSVRARAFDISGASSSWSGTLSVTIGGPPSAPRNLAAVPSNRQIALSWAAPTDNGNLPITNYRLYRDTHPGATSLLVELGNLLSFVDSGLSNGQVYYYVVSAVNWAGEGPVSNEVNATPVTTPSEPLNLTATGGEVWVKLTWLAPSSNGGTSITAYHIYRGTTSDGETHLTTLGAVLEYTDTDVVSGQTYYYRISAANAIGEGLRSQEVSASPFTRIAEKSIFFEMWFWVLITVIVAIVAVAVIVVAFLMRKKKMKPVEELAETVKELGESEVPSDAEWDEEWDELLHG